MRRDNGRSQAPVRRVVRRGEASHLLNIGFSAAGSMFVRYILNIFSGPAAAYAVRESFYSVCTFACSYLGCGFCRTSAEWLGFYAFQYSQDYIPLIAGPIFYYISHNGQVWLTTTREIAEEGIALAEERLEAVGDAFQHRLQGVRDNLAAQRHHDRTDEDLDGSAPIEYTPLSHSRSSPSLLASASASAASVLEPESDSTSSTTRPIRTKKIPARFREGCK